MAIKAKTQWKGIIQAGGNCSKFKWRKQQLKNGAMIYRRTGQKDINKAVRVIIEPKKKNRYAVLYRTASWFDFIGNPKEQNVTKKDAEKIAKKHMSEGFCYD